MRYKKKIKIRGNLRFMLFSSNKWTSGTGADYLRLNNDDSITLLDPIVLCPYFAWKILLSLAHCNIWISNGCLIIFHQKTLINSRLNKLNAYYFAHRQRICTKPLSETKDQAPNNAIIWSSHSAEFLLNSNKDHY
jgi:hypothetical protein